jgi:hypothetical protein
VTLGVSFFVLRSSSAALSSSQDGGKNVSAIAFSETADASDVAEKNFNTFFLWLALGAKPTAYDISSTRDRIRIMFLIAIVGGS